MPLPNTNDIGKILRFLKKENPKMKAEQRLAIAINYIKTRNKKKNVVNVALENIRKQKK